MNSTVTDYTLHGKQVVHLKQGSNNLHFFYDTQGRPAVVDFNGTKYGYVHNLQGDIVALIDAGGSQVVEYTYDAWGKPLTKTGTLAATLGTLNPFRYRGYVYDEETGLYYLRSRYYNPVWGRFLNADSILGKKDNILSHNIFSYCKNSPIVFSDASGHMQDDIGGGAASSSIVSSNLIEEFFDFIIEKLGNYNPRYEIQNGTLTYSEYSYSKSKEEQIISNVFTIMAKVASGAILGALTTFCISNVAIGATAGGMLAGFDILQPFQIDYPVLTDGTYRIREVTYTESMDLCTYRKTHYIIESTDGSNYLAIGYYYSLSGPGIYFTQYKLLYEQPKLYISD